MSGVAVVMSLAAIYSVMSFTVVRRTREIGVRVALGVLLTLGLRSLTFDDAASTLLIVAVYGLLMLAVCATACIVPTRRALSIQPTEALRAEG